MSQEQPPIRSRRELRKARDEAQGKIRDASTAGAGEVAPATKQPATKQPATKKPAASQPATNQADPARAAAKQPGPRCRRTAGRPTLPGARRQRVRPQRPDVSAVWRRVPLDSVPAGSAAERSSQIRARDRAALRTIKELAEKEGQLSAGGPPTRRQLRLMQLEQAVTSAIPVVPPASVESPAQTPPSAGAGPNARAGPAGRPRRPRARPGPATGGPEVSLPGAADRRSPGAARGHDR